MRVMPELLHIRWEKRPPSVELLLKAGEHFWDGRAELAAEFSGPIVGPTICDFCDQRLDPEVTIPVFDGKGKVFSHRIQRSFWFDGPFGACSNCQVKLGIRPGDTGVELRKVRTLWVRNVRRLMRPNLGEVTFYGPG